MFQRYKEKTDCLAPRRGETLTVSRDRGYCRLLTLMERDCFSVFRGEKRSFWGAERGRVDGVASQQGFRNCWHFAPDHSLSGGLCCAWEWIPTAWAEDRDLWVSVVEAVGEMARGPGRVERGSVSRVGWVWRTADGSHYYAVLSLTSPSQTHRPLEFSPVPVF